MACGAVWMLCCTDSHTSPQLRNRWVLYSIKRRLEESLLVPCNFLEMGFSPEIIQLQVKGPRKTQFLEMGEVVSGCLMGSFCLGDVFVITPLTVCVQSRLWASTWSEME